jgi:predicted nuclease of predicted toxin-antitoxin system
MRFVIDINLSPDWVDYLGECGHDAIHWSSIGRVDASDDEILHWARDKDQIVLTSDLDFAALLALSAASTPSVIQLRTESTLSGRVRPLALDAIERTQADLRSGALLTIEAARLRLRILPFDSEC